MNIEEVESQISRNLSRGLSLRDSLDKVGYVIPQQSHPRVTLSDAKGRRKKRNASADNWSAESGQIVVYFETVPPEHKKRRSEPAQRSENPSSSGRDTASGRASSANFFEPDAELLRALDRAESRPGWNFVPLKKFRDEVLPTEREEDLPSLRTIAVQHEALRRVIEKRLVLVGKVPNPKSPQFPVTTIRLNRLIPEVKAALGQRGESDLDFRPVEIRGEPLSATILRERR